MIDFVKNKTVHHREKAKENTKAFNEIFLNRPMTPSTTLLALPQHIHTSTVLQPCSCLDVLSILRLWCPIGPKHWICKACTCFLFASDSLLLSSANGGEPIQPAVLLQGHDRPSSSCFNNNQDSSLAKCSFIMRLYLTQFCCSCSHSVANIYLHLQWGLQACGTIHDVFYSQQQWDFSEEFPQLMLCCAGSFIPPGHWFHFSHPFSPMWNSVPLSTSGG